MSKLFRVEVLRQQHDRTGFDCGVDALNEYFRERVTQDIRRRVTACFVAVESATGRIAGYYTLAAGSIVLADRPEALIKRLPRYPSVPVARLGRLAVDRSFQGQRLGAAMLWDAIRRSMRSEVAVYGLVVDAKDALAAAFYAHHGFVNFGSLPHQWLMPLTGQSLLQAQE